MMKAPSSGPFNHPVLAEKKFKKKKLQPSKKHLPVKEFIRPEQFDKYEKIGKELGFRHVESGALVRSSYKAQKHLT
mgnify:CR=1 FL=1